MVEEVLEDGSKGPKESELEKEGYEEVASPEEDVPLPTMREEIPEVVPVPQEAVDREEPDPSQYDEWSGYVHDLIEFEIGYRPDQAAVIDPENPGNPANNENVLEGDLVDVSADEYGIEVVYASRDHLLDETDYPIENEDEIPEVWADVESTIKVDFDADSFRELREETRKVADYLEGVDQALSNQRNP